MSIKSETSEIVQKLQDLVSFCKNDPIKSNICVSLDAFKVASLEAITIKQALSASGLNQLLIDLNVQKKHIYTLELMHLCLLHDLYTSEDISSIIITLNGRQWDTASKTKILQMCFYFVRFDLSLRNCFQMLNIIIEQFAIEDPTVDLIGRPVVCQIIEKILRRQLDINLQPDEVKINGAQQLFDFLHDLIVNRGFTFTSYILLIIIKFPDIEKITELGKFLSASFIECCIKTLECGKSDDKTPVFETILKIERSFSALVSLEPLYICFPSVYSINPGCENMLRFLVCLFNIRTEPDRLPYPSSLFETLLKFIRNTDFSQKNSEKFIRFYIDIVNVMSTSGGTNEFIEAIFDKIGVLNTKNQMVEKLYFTALEYCSKNDLRGLFEKGLILGYAHKQNTSQIKQSPIVAALNSESHNEEPSLRIEDLDEHVFNIRKYMKSSWYIYFDNTSTHKLDKLSEFSPQELTYFINAIPNGEKIASEVFDNANHCFKMSLDAVLPDLAINTAILLLENLASKIVDDKAYFDLILKFFNLNSSLPASPIPLRFILTRIEQKFVSSERYEIIQNLFDDIIKNINRWMISFYNDKDQENDKLCSYNGASRLQIPGSDHLASFISTFLASMNPAECWSEIFQLIRSIDCHFSIKVDIIMQILTSFMKSLDKKCLNNFFLTIVDTLINFVLFDTKHHKDTADVEIPFDILQKKTTDMFDVFAKYLSISFRETRLWHQMLLFCSEMINQCSEVRSTWMEGVDTKVTELVLQNLEALALHFLNLFFTFFSAKTEASEFSFFEILFKILYELKSSKITLKVLEHLSEFPVEFLLRTRTSDLVEFITRKICEEDEEITRCSFGVLKRLAVKTKDEIQAAAMRESKKKSVEGKDVFVKYSTVKYKAKKHEKTQAIKATNEKSSIDFDEINGLKSEIQNLDVAESNILESKVFNEKLSGVMIDAFEKILCECPPMKSSIIFQVFEEIPSFKLGLSNIFSFSEQLKKFVEMPDPFRTHAVDCFIKACNNSQHFSFCLQILSSWLSENSKETSLSLISKISESLQGDNRAKQTGLCNFMEYSLQFCKSDDFLEPILNLITQCDFPFQAATIERLISFSKKFINGQLKLSYTQAREKILVGYLDFIKHVVDQETCPQNCSKAFFDMVIGIIRQKERYLKMKLKGYRVLFDLRIRCQDILVDEIRRLFIDCTKMFMTHGVGMPCYVINELYFVLEELKQIGDRDIVLKLKREITELLNIRDYKTVEYVMILLRILFSE